MTAQPSLSTTSPARQRLLDRARCRSQAIPPRKRRRQFARQVQVLGCGAALFSSACIAALHSGLPAPSIDAVETAYAGVREAKDAIDALESQLPGAGGHRTLAEWQRLYSERRGVVTARLGALSPVSLGPEDRRAAEAMRRALERDLTPLETTATTTAPQGPPPCEDVRSSALSLATLKRTLVACFAEAAGRIQFEGRTLDRLSALGELARIPEPGRRKKLFLAMEPLWRAVNGEGDAASPYRRLVALAAAEPLRGIARCTEPRAASASTPLRPSIGSSRFWTPGERRLRPIPSSRGISDTLAASRAGCFRRRSRPHACARSTTATTAIWVPTR